MLTRLREIVEGRGAPRLNEALDIWSPISAKRWKRKFVRFYTADHDRRCYYLMATRGLKNLAGVPSPSRLTKASLAGRAPCGTYPTLPMRKTPQL